MASSQEAEAQVVVAIAGREPAAIGGADVGREDGTSCRSEARARRLFGRHPRPVEAEKICCRADSVSAWAM